MIPSTRLRNYLAHGGTSYVISHSGEPFIPQACGLNDFHVQLSYSIDKTESISLFRLGNIHAYTLLCPWPAPPLALPHYSPPLFPPLVSECTLSSMSFPSNVPPAPSIYACMHALFRIILPYSLRMLAISINNRLHLCLLAVTLMAAASCFTNASPHY